VKNLVFSQRITKIVAIMPQNISFCAKMCHFNVWRIKLSLFLPTNRIHSDFFFLQTQTLGKWSRIHQN